jgi:F-type H+-transporting ATPase subunit gamma
MADLSRRIGGAVELQGVVRTMKAVAASNIGQYEQAVRAVKQYYRSVELGLRVCFHQGAAPSAASDVAARPASTSPVRAVVFGSDQGLVGAFNAVVANDTVATLAALPGTSQVWAVGERVYTRLAEAGLSMQGLFRVPASTAAITPLVGQILVACEKAQDAGQAAELRLFYNRSTSGAGYGPVNTRLLPLDDAWRREIFNLPWPTVILAEVVGAGTTTLRSLVREYLFASIFRACAESLASENASRLAAMQRADRNINELLQTLRSKFNYLRQESIDEELFDVVSGFEALSGGTESTPA